MARRLAAATTFARTRKSLRIHNVELVSDLTLLPNTMRKPQLFPNSTGSRLVVNGPKESSGNKNTKYHPLLLQPFPKRSGNAKDDWSLDGNENLIIELQN
ncbi:uncharacterized protein LOC112903340 isoform X2 [Panicum hallii]|uniref:uncharacterized protein LOC112903340 isoform X2 n=1 Tax=Panicum hallii TaxID=206008 RepID=UPI000DF4DBC8|nr:uncharacterized protein LOC112903340 isoform X2 [Panicum hallii]